MRARTEKESMSSFYQVAITNEQCQSTHCRSSSPLETGENRFEPSMTGQLTRTEMENLLHSQLIGRLACINGEEPYIVPMAYAFTGTELVGQTSPGLKLRILRQHPKVCFEVDQLIDLRNWKSVIVYGTFLETPEASMPQARRWLFNRIYPLSTPAQIHSQGHAVEAQLADDTRMKPVLFSISIDRMTGRYERQ
ncbi:MAG: hypothetical protein FJX92_04050 [Bacteroidetes bacterium]|nr:hypothetical protein [Bacteroidota bacterium]